MVTTDGANHGKFPLEVVAKADHARERVKRVHFVAAESSLRVIAEELGLSGRNDLSEKLLGTAAKKTVQHSNADVGAAIASPHYPAIITAAAAKDLSK